MGPTNKEIAQLQRRVNDLRHLQLPEPALEDIQRIDDLLTPPYVATDPVKKIRESLNLIRPLRA